MSAFHAIFCDESDPDIDVEEGRYGFCWNCECNVRSVSADFGIGPFEYWGSKEVHHDWRDVCPTCQEEIGDPEPELTEGERASQLSETFEQFRDEKCLREVNLDFDRAFGVGR